MEVNSGGYLLGREAARLISTTFTDTEVNYSFSIYNIDAKNVVYFSQYIENGGKLKS